MDTLIMKSFRVGYVSDTRVGHTCHVYFLGYAAHRCVMSISALPCSCNRYRI